MNYCKIENSLVVNCAVFDQAMPSTWPDYAKWVQNDEAGIGWTYVNGIFTAPPEPETKPQHPLPPTNEQTVIYDHENRIREIEGEPPLSLGDFLAKLNKPPP